MAALLQKVASSKLAGKLASTNLGQKIIGSSNPDVLEQQMLERRRGAAPEGAGPPPPGVRPPRPPGLPGADAGAGASVEGIGSSIEKNIEEKLQKVVELKDKFDSKLDSNYWLLRIVLVIVVVTIISIIIYRYKLPLICYGCESPKGFSQYIFRCVTDTSQDSDLCKISTAIDKGTEGLGREFEKITIISRSVFKQFTADIPDTIRNALTNILEKISALVKTLKNDIANLSEKVGQFLFSTFNTIKDITIKSYNELYNIVIKPIVDFISSSIITPISTIITQLIKFKEIITTSITNVTSKVTGVFTDLGRNIIAPIAKLPKSLEVFINQIIRFLNGFAKKGAEITRDSIGKVIDGVETAVNKIIGFLNDFAKEGAKITRDSIEKVVGGIQTAVNDGIITPLNKGVNATVGVINKVASGTVGVTRTAVHGTIDGIQGAVNTSIDGINKIAKGATTITRDAVNTTIDGIQTAVNTTVGGINKATADTVGVARTAVHGTIDGIEGAVNKTVGGINEMAKGTVGVTRSAVHGTIDGIQGAVNSTVDGINRVTSETVGVARTAVHGVVGGIESSVNSTVDGINRATSSVATGISNTVNPIVGAVNTTVRGLNSARNVRVPDLKLPQINFPGLNFGALGSTQSAKIIDEKILIPGFQPLSFIPAANEITFNGISIPSVSKISINKPTINTPSGIPRISINKPTINDPRGIPNISINKPTLNAPPGIPNVTIPKPTIKDLDSISRITINKPSIPDPQAVPGIDISRITIPKPTIIDPKAIDGVKIPRPDIKDPNVIPDVSLDRVQQDIENGISGAYDKATGGIRQIYNDAMTPINNAIISLTTLATSLVASFTLFFNKYINAEFFYRITSLIKEKAYITIGQAIDIIYKNVITPVYDIIIQIKKKIFDFIDIAMLEIKKLVKTILEKINLLFNTLSDTLYATGMFIVKNIFYVTFYAFTNMVDKLIPLKIQKTVKVNFVIVTTLYILFLYYTSQLRAVIKELASQYYILLLLLGSFTALYFLFPTREEVLEVSKVIEDSKIISKGKEQIIQQIKVSLPSNITTEKFDNYENIEQYSDDNYEKYGNYGNIEEYSDKSYGNMEQYSDEPYLIEPYTNHYQENFSHILF